MYIRFGKIPEDELSTITWRQVIVGFEKGVSVWDCVKIRNTYRIVLPEKCNDNTIEDLNWMIKNCNNEVYLVEGDYVCDGSDGEPVIKNVKIIKDISNEINYNYNNNEYILSYKYTEITDYIPNYFDLLNKGKIKELRIKVKEYINKSNK